MSKVHEFYFLVTQADICSAQALIREVNAAYAARSGKVRKAHLDQAYDLAQDLTSRLTNINVICSGETG